jgi:hypothetical protein
MAHEEVVVCALCGHTRHNLVQHLPAKHGIEPKAYERRYGSYISERFRAVQIDLLADNSDSSAFTTRTITGLPTRCFG